MALLCNKILRGFCFVKETPGPAVDLAASGGGVGEGCDKARGEVSVSYLRKSKDLNMY